MIGGVYLSSVHENRIICLSAAPGHQVNGLLQFVPQFVFATITVSVQRCQDLFLVLIDVEVELTQRAQSVELVAMETRLFHQVGVHVLVGDTRHLCYVPVVPLNPVLVVGDVFCVQQFVGG